MSETETDDLVTGRRYLTGVQYADDSNLQARQSIYDYQHPRIDIHRWVLSLAGLSEGESFLEVGCGNGRYLSALFASGHLGPILGVDLSAGMLRAAALSGAPPALAVGDAAELPLRSRAFDVLLAAHVLQHVPHRPAALVEFRRVLRPGSGRALVVTNGSDHLDGLDSVLGAALADVGRQGRRARPFSFHLEQAEAQLSAVFSEVELHRAGSYLHITEPGPVLAYARSMSEFLGPAPGEPADQAVLDRIGERVEEAIVERGELAIRTSVGCFVCR